MNARLSPQREAEIAARTEAASPSPWFLHEDWPGRVFSESEFNHHIARVTGTNPERNEAFIAHAREDVPALLAELAAVRAERDELADRARRVAASHREFIAEHSDPGTEALAAQCQLDQYLVGQHRRCPGFAPEYQGVSDAKRRLARCKHCRQDRFASTHTEGATS